MNEHLTKGRPVFIEGRLRLDQWQVKDGSKRSQLKVVVQNFLFLDSKPQDDRVQTDTVSVGVDVAEDAP